MTINATALNSTDVKLTLDGEDVTVSGLTVTGGTGNDTIIGSGTADIIGAGAEAPKATVVLMPSFTLPTLKVLTSLLTLLSVMPLIPSPLM